MNGTDAGLAALTIAIVAGIRKHFPQLDGLIVVALAGVVAIAAVAASGPIESVSALIRHALVVFSLAVGTNAWAASLADKAASSGGLAPLLDAGAAKVEQTTTTTATVDATPADPKDGAA